MPVEDTLLECDDLQALRVPVHQAVGVFADEFGTEYAKQTAERLAGDSHAGVFLVRRTAEEGTAEVGAFAVFLYDCLAPDADGSSPVRKGAMQAWRL